MEPTKELIIKGCKFILNLGADKWDSKLTRKAIERMRDLCQLQLDEWSPVEPNYDAYDEAQKIFK